MKAFDAVVLGAGAAGMMCALQAGRRGRRVALIDHSPKIGMKILISGGGRFNFTNTGAGPSNYLSSNPSFCRSVLARFTPDQFIQMVRDNGIAFHEKKLGQLFCDGSAKLIVDMLTRECRGSGAEFFAPHRVERVDKAEGFQVTTDREVFSAPSLVVATGGLSIPKIGATDLGYKLARQFGLNLVATAPALDGFTLAPKDLARFQNLPGVSADVLMTCEGVIFRENILFTHAGLSGPAALQASLYWLPGPVLRVNFLPDQTQESLLAEFVALRRQGSRLEMKTLLAKMLPKRLAECLCGQLLTGDKNIHKLSDKKLAAFCRGLQEYALLPTGTVGYGKAEVTRGGVDTRELSSQTMQAVHVPGLYFIGEVVDVTGWLGGYNFQWAWSSGWAAGQSV